MLNALPVYIRNALSLANSKSNLFYIHTAYILMYIISYICVSTVYCALPLLLFCIMTVLVLIFCVLSVIASLKLPFL